MKHLHKLIPTVFLSLLLLIPAAFAVFYYAQPMKDVSYKLFSLGEDGEELWTGGEGWSFYTNEGGKETALISDGRGGYTGLSSSGQTFYYSRLLTEELDSPMLKIGVANRTVSVFLDDALIYTDCPELDNRIGFLMLPMLDYDRAEPLTVSLPPDYQGKLLTIAQSTAASEKQVDDGTVWPCEVTLYCGYAYESSLIASAAQTLIPAVLLFALLLFLLAAFTRSAATGNLQPKLLIFALALLFQMCGVLAKADFFFHYFGELSLDPAMLCFHLSVGTLLLVLTLYASRLRMLFAAVTLLQWCCILLSYFTQTGNFTEYGKFYVFLRDLPQISGFLTLAAALTGAFLLWRLGNRFFRHLAQTALFLLVGYAAFLAISIPFLPDYAASVLTRILQEAHIRLPWFSLSLLYGFCLLSTLTSVFLELIEQAAERQSEVAVLSAKNELALESYTNLRRQSEEIMMLRHDTMKHYQLLRTMAQEQPQQIGPYLDELIGQTAKIRPVISCGNKTLEILLNGKLNLAAAKKIPVETIRCDAPETLPLSDAELCSLITNILDNAICAAAASRRPYIKLDLHCKGQHFVFSCENTMPNTAAKHKKTPIPEHGYGLKIIRQIMKRFGDNMLSIEQDKNIYRITAVIPL